MAVRAYCIPRKDLDPEDPRRSERPSEEFLQDFWDRGLLLVDSLEFDRFFRRKNKVRKNKLPISKRGPTVEEQKRNYGSWLPRQIRVCSNQDLAPADTNDSRAQPLLVLPSWVATVVVSPTGVNIVQTVCATCS